MLVEFHALSAAAVHTDAIVICGGGTTTRYTGLLIFDGVVEECGGRGRSGEGTGKRTKMCLFEFCGNVPSAVLQVGDNDWETEVTSLTAKLGGGRGEGTVRSGEGGSSTYSLSVSKTSCWNRGRPGIEKRRKKKGRRLFGGDKM